MDDEAVGKLDRYDLGETPPLKRDVRIPGTRNRRRSYRRDSDRLSVGLENDGFFEWDEPSVFRKNRDEVFSARERGPVDDENVTARTVSSLEGFSSDKDAGNGIFKSSRDRYGIVHVG